MGLAWLARGWTYSCSCLPWSEVRIAAAWRNICIAVFLDEWEFDRYSPLSWSTQLMWFDNKAICITRPQNNCNGHLIYRGTAPIFITAKLKNVGPTHERAQAAAAEGKSSDDTMMMRRLRCYLFTEKLPIPVGVVVPQCGCCWSQMILGYAHQAGHC